MAEKKENKRRFHIHINLGFIVFFVIIIYITVYTINYLGKDKLAIYEVTASNISDTVSGTGMILREESLITMEEDGYVNYYVKDGSRVQEGGIVYTIDTTGKLQSYLNKLLEEKSSVSSEEKSQIYEDLQTFNESFSDNDFSEVYEAKSDIDHDLMSYTDTVIADNKDKLEEKYGEGCYVEVEAEDTGLVSFSSDGLEEVDEESFTKEIFDSSPKMNDLRSDEKMEAGSSVYRIVTGQDWELIIPVNEDNYNRILSYQEEGYSTLQLTFNKDNFETSASFSCREKDDGYYIILYFNNYVQRYLDQRYLSVELLLSETDGLKIPSSSLINKEVYKIPSEYLTQGSNSSEKNQVNVLTTNKKGEEVLTQVTVTRYRTEGDYVLVTSSELKKGDKISDLEKSKTYTLKDTSILQGVYVVNRGYAVFEPVTILQRNEDYCIISTDDSDVELYDRVILNSDTIEENQVIY
ncbi:MAG: hypothetical protein LUF92_13875 [Clostridiales bacterium]|nr:hypothetical protein [Clostridiales bacterium]